jgi:hypothetical protein
MMKARGLIGLSWLMLAAGPPARAAEAPADDMYAVIIGHNGGNAQLPQLEYADDDAVRFASLFRGLGARRVWLLTAVDEPTRNQLSRAGIEAGVSAPPTRRAVLAAFDEAAREIAARRATRPPSLYVLYAGHGLHGRVLLQPERAAEAALTGDEIRVALAQILDADARARLFVFLDACRSQSLFSERGDASRAGPDLREAVRALERRVRAVRVGVLTAAHTGRPAGEVRALGAGYFSHVLASGLAGAADADGDERITFGELAAFVAFHTQKLTGQMPWFDPPGGDLQADALDHRGRRPRLVLNAAEPAHFLISAAAGVPVFAEAHKARARPLRIVLPVGSYRIVRLFGRRLAEEAAVELRAGAAIDLDALAWRHAAFPPTATRGDDGAAFGTLAFSEPFSPEIVSTLTAGYEAGRKPSERGVIGPHRIAAAFEVGPAPLGLLGLAPGFVIGYRHQPAHLALGARVFASTSRHVIGAERYALARLGAAAELGYGMRLTRNLEALAWGAAGFASTLRVAEATAGDLLGPLVAIGLLGEWRLGEAVGLFGELRWTAHWIKIDGVRQATAGPAASAGVSTWF